MPFDPKDLFRAPKGKPQYALGRLPPGTMNKTEAQYAQHLEYRRLMGEVAWWKFEAVKLRIAPATFLTVDFAVMLMGGELQMHDVKGSAAVFEDDARVKLKVAADMFPLEFFVAMPRPKRDGGGWIVEPIRKAREGE